MLPFAVCSAVGGTICTVFLSYPLRQAQSVAIGQKCSQRRSAFPCPQVLGCAKQKRPRKKKKREPQEWQHEDLESSNSTDFALSQRSKTKREQQDEMQPRFPLLRRGIRSAHAFLHTQISSPCPGASGLHTSARGASLLEAQFSVLAQPLD